MGGPSVPPNFWSLVHARKQYEKQRPNLHGDHGVSSGQRERKGEGGKMEREGKAFPLL